MRIVHITNNVFDGVGRAVMRLHKELIKSGVDSHIIVLYKSQTDVDVTALLGEYTDRKLIRKTKSIWINIFNKIFKYNIIILIKIILLKVVNYFLNVKRNLYLFNYIFPLIRFEQISSHIDKKDIICLYSVQEMFKPEFLPLINQISNYPIIIRPLDMEPLTGGCHFNYGCSGYMDSCSRCPQINYSRICEIPRKNMLRKKKGYSSVDFRIIASNNFVQSLAKKSTLFADQKIDVIYLGIESERYRQVPQKIARNKLNIPTIDKVVVYGCFNLENPRKGSQILKKSLFEMTNNMNDFDSNSKRLVHLVTFGDLRDFTFSDVNIKWTHLGYIDSTSKMNMIYRSADVLVSPSIDDLGPTIVQEAFLNNLPVVAFNLGIAKDLIINQVNGYIIPCFKVHEFANAIKNTLMGKLKATEKHKKRIKQLQEKCSIEYEVKAYNNLMNSLILTK